MGINAPQQLVQKLRIVLCSFPWANYLTPNYYTHGVVDEETHVTCVSYGMLNLHWS